MKKVYVILIIMALSISACKSNDREETTPVFDTSQAKNEQVMEDDVEESTIEQRKEDIFVPEQFGKIYMADEYEYMVLGANEVSIVKYIGNAANLNIPSDIKGATVTEIGGKSLVVNFESLVAKQCAIVYPFRYELTASGSYRDSLCGSLSVVYSQKNYN